MSAWQPCGKRLRECIDDVCRSMGECAWPPETPAGLDIGGKGTGAADSVSSEVTAAPSPPSPHNLPASFPTSMAPRGRAPQPPVEPGTHSSPLPEAPEPPSGSGEQAPAGGVVGKPRPPAGIQDARTFTIELPAGLQIVTLNDRHHWRTRHRLGGIVKDAAIVMARKAKVPPLKRAAIVAEYRPPDRRRRDPDNIMPAVKNAIDGIVKAGVLAGDDTRYVASVTCVIGEPYPRGRLVLYVTEAPADASAGAA